MQFQSEEECFNHLEATGKRYFADDNGCNGTFDKVLCFEATPADTTLKLQCPQMAGVFDASSKMTRTVALIQGIHS